MSASESASRGGQPSTTTPTAPPCDSPQVVIRNRCPKVLPIGWRPPAQCRTSALYEDDPPRQTGYCVPQWVPPHWRRNWPCAAPVRSTDGVSGGAYAVVGSVSRTSSALSRAAAGGSQ